jgi:hypothetical protein
MNKGLRIRINILLVVGLFAGSGPKFSEADLNRIFSTVCSISKYAEFFIFFVHFVLNDVRYIKNKTKEHTKKEGSGPGT